MGYLTTLLQATKIHIDIFRGRLERREDDNDIGEYGSGFRKVFPAGDKRFKIHN